MSAWSDIVIAAVSAITGGGLLKVADTWLNKAKMRNETAKQLRDEAREETLALKNEVLFYKTGIREKDKEIDDWRTKYWEVFMEYKNFQLKVGQLLIENGISPGTLLKDEDDT